jgi:hypothetical protein
MVFQLYLERIIAENLLSVGLINYQQDSIDTGILGIRIEPDMHFAISRTEKRKMALVYHLSPLRPYEYKQPFTVVNKLIFTKTELACEEYEKLTGYKVLDIHGDLKKRATIPAILFELYFDNDIFISGFMSPVVLSSFRNYKNAKLEELNEIYRMINQSIL